MADKPEKAERLAAALRDNLRRRKAQARAAAEQKSTPAKAGVQPERDRAGKD